jgi:hypothetical protein
MGSGLASQGAGGECLELVGPVTVVRPASSRLTFFDTYSSEFSCGASGRHAAQSQAARRGLDVAKSAAHTREQKRLRHAPPRVHGDWVLANRPTLVLP